MPVLASAVSENFVSSSTLALGGGFMNPDIIVESFGLQPGMKVADFGSGSGYFTILIAKKEEKTSNILIEGLVEFFIVPNGQIFINN